LIGINDEIPLTLAQECLYKLVGLTTYGIILVKVNYLRAYFIPWGWKRMLVEKNVGGKECWWK